MDQSNSKEPKEASGVAVLDRACSILFAFRPTDSGLTLAELAARTGLYKSTILRLTESLIHHRLLLRLDDGRFRVGPACFGLGAVYQRSLNLGDVLLPLMRELAAESGESVSFYMRDGNVRVCLHRVDSEHSVRFHVREGDVLPLEAGSGGLTLLAFSGEPGERFEQIRRNGYYASVGERDSESAGVSAPVFGQHHTLAGVITLAGPTSRIDAAFMERMREPVIDTSARASAALGDTLRRVAAPSR